MGNRFITPEDWHRGWRDAWAKALAEVDAKAREERAQNDEKPADPS